MRNNFGTLQGPGVLDNIRAEGIDQKLTAFDVSVPEKHVEIGGRSAGNQMD